MTAPAAHNAFLATAASRVCETCGGEYAPRTRHATRFCSDRCRMAFHGAEARIEKIRGRAVDLYDALVTARELLRGRDLEHAVINHPELPQVGLGQRIDQALSGLKPPVEPKALLEKAKA